MNVGECIDKAIKYIAQYSNSGVIVSTNDNLDYTLRARTFIDTAQKEVASIAKIHKCYTFTQSPVDPVNGKFSGFALKQFIPGKTGDLVDICGVNGQSFHCEVDRPCSIYVEESSNNGETWTNVGVSWTDGATTNTANPIVVTGNTSYVYRKGLINPSDATNLIRLRFTGAYKFTRRNTAIWNFPFETPITVDNYSDRIEYTINDNKWLQYHETVHRYDDRQFDKMVSLDAVGQKTIYVNYFYNGQFDIWYYKIPEDITNNTPDNQELEVYPGMPQECIPFYVGAHMIMDEYQSLAITLLNEYEAKKANLVTYESPSANTQPYVIGAW